MALREKTGIISEAKAKAVMAEVKHLQLDGKMITPDKAMTLITVLTSAVRHRVTDRASLAAIRRRNASRRTGQARA